MRKLFLLLFLFAFVPFCYSQDTVKIQRVVDGDTFVLENGDKVRLLGIDTPEKYESSKLDKDAEMSKKDKATIIALGNLSSKYADDMLSNATVILVGDSTNSDKDKYGRLLRYAYLLDGTFFNLKIIQDGYAYAYTRFPLIYVDQFRQAEREARENKKGLWGDVDFSDLDTE